MSNNAEGRAAGKILLFLLLVSTAVLLAGVINARTVRLEYSDARIRGLDARLEGVKVLYVSDLKISSPADARRAVRMIRTLCECEPDVLIIGGDICSKSLTDTIKERFFGRTAQETAERLSLARDEFLSGLNGILVKYGVYAVYGDADTALGAQQQAAYSTRFLNNSTHSININGARLCIAGYADIGVNAYGAFRFSPDAAGAGATLVMFHDPRIYNTAVLEAKKQKGAYLFLSGHTLDGQIKLGGRALLYPDISAAYPSGVYSDESGLAMLVSSGAGSEGFPFRLGTRARAYLITLNRGVGE